MDTEGGGWTEYARHGPGYMYNHVGEVIFNTPQWKKELGFNEYYIVADKQTMWW